jgi:hypothetical protein
VELLEAADDPPPDRPGEAIAKAERERKPSLDDRLSKEPKPQARLALPMPTIRSESEER